MQNSLATDGQSPPTENRKSWYYVYILKCSKGKLYYGCTTNIRERITRHKKGHVPATKNILPVQLVVCTAFEDKYRAFRFEKYLKSGSGRAFTSKHFLK